MSTSSPASTVRPLKAMAIAPEHGLLPAGPRGQFLPNRSDTGGVGARLRARIAWT
jgi:hypothetical protein